MNEIDSTLSERGERYGDFKDVARITNSLFATCREGNQFHQLSESQNLALRMICIKIARAVNGDPNYIENWHDIAGYSTLIEKSLMTTEGATNAKVVAQKVINGVMEDV